MKFNPEIARDILLDIEELHNYPDSLYLSHFETFKRTSSQDRNTILYHLEKLSEANFIIWKAHFASNDFHIGVLSGITYQGHQFLDSIRDPKIWQETKSKAQTVGVFTLDFISQTASQIIANYLNPPH